MLAAVGGTSQQTPGIYESTRDGELSLRTLWCCMFSTAAHLKRSASYRYLLVFVQYALWRPDMFRCSSALASPRRVASLALQVQEMSVYPATQQRNTFTTNLHSETITSHLRQHDIARSTTRSPCSGAVGVVHTCCLRSVQVHPTVPAGAFVRDEHLPTQNAIMSTGENVLVASNRRQAPVMPVACWRTHLFTHAILTRTGSIECAPSAYPKGR